MIPNNRYVLVPKKYNKNKEPIYTYRLAMVINGKNMVMYFAISYTVMKCLHSCLRSFTKYYSITMMSKYHNK